MLNFHHLRIFHAVAREGGLRQAAERLHLTQPTMSAQIHLLEDALGEPLFLKVGRRLVLTTAGRTALEYADEIFSLGRQLEETFAGGRVAGPRRLHVGIVNSLPKLVARELLRPAVEEPHAVRLICHEGSMEDLITRLTGDRMDLVLSDEPVSGDQHTGIFNHKLGSCGVVICGLPAMGRKCRRDFPNSLNDMPLLLPAVGMPLRRAIDAWLLQHSLAPRIAGEFDDMALLKDFAAEGLGLAPVLEMAVPAAQRLYGLTTIGKIEGVRAEYYALSAQRTLRNPAIGAILAAAPGEKHSVPRDKK